MLIFPEEVRVECEQPGLDPPGNRLDVLSLGKLAKEKRSKDTL